MYCGFVVEVILILLQLMSAYIKILHRNHFLLYSKLYKHNNALVAIGSSGECRSKPSQVVLLGVSS